MEENSYTSNRKENSNSLEHMDKGLEVLTSTLSILNECRQDNICVRKQLIQRIEELEIPYQYGKNQEIVIDFSELQKHSSFDGKLVNEIDILVDKYNCSIEKSNKISKNIEDIQKSFFSDFKNECKELVKISMEEVGIQILEAQEKERNRIACDLHDSVIQNLTSLVHKAELCIRTMDEDIVGAKLDLQIMINYIRSVINDIRGIIYNLRPMTLDDLGIVVSIERFLDDFKQNTNIKVNLMIDPEIAKIHNSIINLTILRIIQESCANAFKHGKADQINIEMHYNKQQVELEIRDNGVGFEVQKLQTNMNDNKSGFGLSIMKERVYLLSGDICINSEIGKGTVIKVEVPTSRC